MSFLSGILAALAAPLVMTVGFIVWDNHWAGSPFSLNLYKCNMASIGFLILSAVTRPEDPFSSEIFVWQNVGFLMLSSVIGIIVGDLTWLEGLRLLGARRVIVMDSLKPFLAAVFGWAFLGEELRPAALGGIALTVVGIVLVSLEAEQQPDVEAEEEIIEGIIQQEKDEVSSTKQDVEASSHTIGTALADPSTLSLATGSSPDSSGNTLPVVVDESEVEAPQEHEPVQIAADACPDDQTATAPSAAEESTRQSLTNADKRAQTRQQLLWGYALSIINVVLDTYGSVLTKEYGAEFTTWEINLVRFGFAGLVMGICSVVLVLRDWLLTQGDGKEKERTQHAESNEANEEEEQSSSQQPKWYQLPTATMTRSAWAHVSLGVLFVTFFTPALSNYALFQIALALALTLGSVGPLYALPLTYLMQRKEHTKRPSLRACMGALLAVAGIVILAFWGMLE